MHCHMNVKFVDNMFTKCQVNSDEFQSVAATV
jgi:hypothetical protein